MAWRDAIASRGTAAALGDLTKYYFKLWGSVANAISIGAEQRLAFDVILR